MDSAVLSAFGRELQKLAGHSAAKKVIKGIRKGGKKVRKTKPSGPPLVGPYTSGPQLLQLRLK